MSNINYFKVQNFNKCHFNLFNSIVSINETDNYDYLIEGEISSQALLRDIIIRIYFFSPDKMYKIIFENDIIAIPNYEKYGIIDLVKEKIELVDFYKDKFFSFCVYNNKPKYTIGAIKNCQQYKKQYPDYKILFFVRNDVPDEIIQELERENGLVIKTLFVPDWFMMFTRFLPSEQAQFNASRDTDCRLINREIYVNSVFMNSEDNFHIIRDHPYHSTEILGGMWSSKNLEIKDLRFKIINFCLDNMNRANVEMGHDQNFLRHYIYPKLNLNKTMVHDNYFHYNKNKLKIDMSNVAIINDNYFNIQNKLDDKAFIGEPYDENDNYELKFRQVL